MVQLVVDNHTQRNNAGYANRRGVVIQELNVPQPPAQQLHNLRVQQGGVFPVTPELEPKVNFWRDIFSKYSEKQFVVHSQRNPELVYGVVDTRKGPGVQQSVQRIRNDLMALHKSGQPRTESQRHLSEVLENFPDRNKYLRAATELRVQQGMREQFASGIKRSGLYMAQIKTILGAQKVPQELALLPFVESSFHPGAFSSAGAAGVWQLMPDTARDFNMRVDEDIDERRDTLRSTKAAAAYLRRANDKLGGWPVAVVSYNHGVGGIKEAIEKTGTRDIAKIIEQYRGPAFGFASRNYYPSFLAAIDVYNNRDVFFPQAKPDAPLAYKVIKTEEPLTVQQFSEKTGVDLKKVLALNPGFGEKVRLGEIPIPQAYEVRVPIQEKKAKAKSR